MNDSTGMTEFFKSLVKDMYYWGDHVKEKAS